MLLVVDCHNSTQLMLSLSNESLPRLTLAEHFLWSFLKQADDWCDVKIENNSPITDFPSMNPLLAN